MRTSYLPICAGILSPLPGLLMSSNVMLFFLILIGLVALVSLFQADAKTGAAPKKRVTKKVTKSGPAVSFSSSQSKLDAIKDLNSSWPSDPPSISDPHLAASEYATASVEQGE